MSDNFAYQQKFRNAIMFWTSHCLFGSFCVNCERYDYEELRMAVNSFICKTVTQKIILC